MPKIVNYPRKPFETALEIAETVEKLGGKCTEQVLGHKLQKAKGGSFTADIAAAIKHGLISKEKDNLKITDLFKNIKLSYTDEEKAENLIKAFLMPDTYREILERFSGKEIPVDVLDKMLIKEYAVADNVSQRVANNLIKGAENLGLIQDGKVVVSKKTFEETKSSNEDENIKDESTDSRSSSDLKTIDDSSSIKQSVKENIAAISNPQREVVININIQLSVPETTNEEVYEKFFAAMKKNLLS